jgi:hypothetical protein
VRCRDLVSGPDQKTIFQKVLAGVNPTIPDHYSAELQSVISRLLLPHVSLQLLEYKRGANHRFCVAQRLQPLSIKDMKDLAQVRRARDLQAMLIP